ncbi:MAG: hypothetical protein BGO77_06890 [Caedibacter sp. 37-49]|nr:MAG: hypothetical protein BGO77_06890 [Caedibacter sp. 37-49]
MINASLWVLIAFCILIILVGKPAWRALINFLDQHALRIRDNLIEAKRLHTEAEALVAEAKRLQLETTQRSKEIIAHAKTQAEELKKTSHIELGNYIRIEEKLLLERYAQIETQALTEIENKVLEAAIHAAYQELSNSVKSLDQKYFFNETLNKIKDVNKLK